MKPLALSSEFTSMRSLYLKWRFVSGVKSIGFCDKKSFFVFESEGKIKLVSNLII